MTDGWYIPHPGTSEWQSCESFDEAMRRWFEGYNLPRLVTNGVIDTLDVAYKRVRDHFDQDKLSQASAQRGTESAQLAQTAHNQ